MDDNKKFFQDIGYKGDWTDRIDKKTPKNPDFLDDWFETDKNGNLLYEPSKEQWTNYLRKEAINHTDNDDDEDMWLYNPIVENWRNGNYENTGFDENERNDFYKELEELRKKAFKSKRDQDDLIANYEVDVVDPQILEARKEKRDNEDDN